MEPKETVNKSTLLGVKTFAKSRSYGGSSKVGSQRAQNNANAVGIPGPQSPLVDISNVVFNPRCEEITNTWSTGAKEILVINAFQNGITASLHRNWLEDYNPACSLESRSAKAQSPAESSLSQSSGYRSDHFHLRLRETRDFQLAPGKYFVYKENFADALEDLLSLLNRQGKLDSTVCYFGCAADPFFSFHKKFNVTMCCLDLLEKYRPMRVVVQTRSPMVIAGLPMLKSLGDRAVVVIPIETHLERIIYRYTPSQPKIAERLLAIEGLRAQGITVNISVSPILPYGDYYRNAWEFADLLNTHADYITFGCLSDGSESAERELKNLELGKKLAEDKQYRWLRPYSYRVLFATLKHIAPDKLRLPVSLITSPSQLEMFVA